MVLALYTTFAAMVYDLPVVDEKVKPQQITSLHLMCALAFTGTGAIIFIYNFKIQLFGLALLLAGLLLLGLTMAKNKWVTSPKVNIVFRSAELVVALAIALLSLKEQWKFPSWIFGILSAAILYAFYWERTAGTILYVQVADEGLRLPVTSRKRFIPWTEIEQVVLRYGTLSIDCIDNRLMQWDLLDTKINPNDFETWCAEQVEANKSKRINDEW